MASRSCSAVSPPSRRLVRVPHHAVVQAHAQLQHGRVAAEVLVGQEQHLAALLERPLQGALALDDVHTVPPCRPVNALMSAEEFMYVTGMTSSAIPRSSSASQHCSTWLYGRHVRHRAAGREVGQDDLLLRRGEDVGGLGHEVDAAEDDVLGLGPRRRLARQLEGVAGDVGELDDLVALVVVAEDEDPVAERPARRPRPGHQGGVAGAAAARRGSSTPRSAAGSAPAPSTSSGSERPGLVACGPVCLAGRRGHGNPDPDPRTYRLSDDTSS